MRRALANAPFQSRRPAASRGERRTLWHRRRPGLSRSVVPYGDRRQGLERQVANGRQNGARHWPRRASGRINAGETRARIGGAASRRSPSLRNRGRRRVCRRACRGGRARRISEAVPGHSHSHRACRRRRCRRPIPRAAVLVSSCYSSLLVIGQPVLQSAATLSCNARCLSNVTSVKGIGFACLSPTFPCRAKTVQRANRPRFAGGRLGVSQTPHDYGRRGGVNSPGATHETGCFQAGGLTNRARSRRLVSLNHVRPLLAITRPTSCLNYKTLNYTRANP